MGRPATAERVAAYTAPILPHPGLGVVLRVSLPLVVLLCCFALPAAAGERVTVTGVVSVLEVDHEDGRPPERIVSVRDRDGVTGPPGRPLRVRAAPVAAAARATGEPVAAPVPPPPLVSGQLLRVNGEVQGETLLYSESQADALAVLAGPTPLAATGPNDAVVILGNFQNLSLTCTLPDVDGLVFSDADALGELLDEASFGGLHLTGTTLGPYTIPFNSSSYAYEAWDDALRAAATLDGEDLSGFEHHIYVLPPNAIGSGGLGTVGVDPLDGFTKAWIFNCSRPGSYAHEFGHNLTLAHASRFFADTLVVWNYGDASDNMGSQTLLRHYNGPHKLRLGWVPESRVRTVTQDGIYTIRRLEDVGGGGDQLLRIQNVDPTISPFFDTEFYYVSYRAAVGFDVNLPADEQNRVFVHETSAAGATTYLRQWLDTAETFSEPVGSLSNVTVRVVSQDGTNATVEVLGVPPPVPSLSWLGLAALAGLVAVASVVRPRARPR